VPLGGGSKSRPSPCIGYGIRCSSRVLLCEVPSSGNNLLHSILLLAWLRGGFRGAQCWPRMRLRRCRWRCEGCVMPLRAGLARSSSVGLACSDRWQWGHGGGGGGQDCARDAPGAIGCDSQNFQQIGVLPCRRRICGADLSAGCLVVAFCSAARVASAVVLCGAAARLGRLSAC
jgi:hypothetical protein